MLSLINISTAYDGVPMLRDVCIDVPAGRLICLLGGNGAGKTTTVKTILGLIKPTGGDIRFEGRSLLKCKPDRRIQQGIAVVPEGRRLFPKMTVRENLRLGAFFIKDPQDIRRRMARVFHLFPGLESRARQTAGTLSGGEQSMVSIGRGLMSRPRLLILDEPSLGLSPKLVQAFFNTIQSIHAQKKTTVLLIEQNAAKALAVADASYILQKGRIIASGSATELAASDAVKKAYLATDEAGNAD